MGNKLEKLIIFLALFILGCITSNEIDIISNKKLEWKPLLIANVDYEHQIEKSNNFEYNVIKTEWKNGDFLIINKNGIIEYYLPQLEIRKYFKFAIDSRIIGRSTDGNIVWFESTFDYIVCYGVINISKAKYLLFEPPKNYGDYQICINYDTGDVLYSDYPFQGDTINAENTKKSDKLFHLYKYNFFTGINETIDENIGEGFLIELKESNFYYEKE
jgi:hypothetical protein